MHLDLGERDRVGDLTGVVPTWGEWDFFGMSELQLLGILSLFIRKNWGILPHFWEMVCRDKKNKWGVLEKK